MAVSFCNQRVRDCGLAIVDGDQSRWVPWPNGMESSGATGMALTGGRLVLAAQVAGGAATLLAFDESWNVKVHHIPGPSDAHDIASSDDGLLLVSSGTDSIWLLDSTPFKLWSVGEARADEYHINGVTAEDSRILTSMFGPKHGRSWPQVMDGTVVAVPSGEVIVEGLHHPHSPRLCDGQLWVCDSSRGEVVVVADGHQERIMIGGYTRGLWIGPDVALVGVSAARSRSRSRGTKNLVSRDAFWSGLAVVDRHRLVVTDRVDLSGLGGEVYDILPVEAFEIPPGLDARVEYSLRLLQRIDELEVALRSVHSTRRSVLNVLKNLSTSVRHRVRSR